MEKNGTSNSVKRLNSFDDIYEVVKLIPKGRVTSYGAIARYLGTHARIVGWAMNAVPKGQNIPAHRVVNRNGVLTGKEHFSPPESMQEYLESEGLIIQDNQIQDFAQFYWEPGEELL
jgi:methylated-DNA-protein-cysteine methyltransferase-like protein